MPPPACACVFPGSLCRYVQEVDRGYVWVTFSPAIRGRAFATQVRCACLQPVSRTCNLMLPAS